MSAILVTGANGFVGRALCSQLIQNGHNVVALVRRGGQRVDGVREWSHQSADFERLNDAWPADFAPDCVIHLAARVHVMNDDVPDPLAAFRATNVEGTLRVARAALHHGARRFVYVSSIKAVGESDHGRPINEDVPTAPGDPYGRSKHEAEDALWALQRESGIEVVIVRPPLVYGPGVGANFLRMLRAVYKGVPLPFGGVRAKRSLVYVENLANALMQCALDPRAANRCFHVADVDDLSVAELLRAIGRHLGRPARLMSVPPGALRLAGVLTGRQAQIDRLTGSLQVDSSSIRRQLDWRQPFSTADGLDATARWFLSTCIPNGDDRS